MKYNILFVISIALQMIPVSGFSQDNTCVGAGVYLTYDDFVNNKLSNTVNFNELSNKFKFVYLPWQNTIKIIVPDTAKYGQRSVIKFKSGSIYGYYEYGKKYRYVEGKGIFYLTGYFDMFKEMKGLIVYKQYVRHKHFGDYHYYYSIDLKSAVKPMNKKNLVIDANNFSNAKFMNVVTLIKNKWINNNKKIIDTLINAYEESDINKMKHS